MAPAPRVRFYRNIVGTFVALNIVLLLFVVYLSFVKATISITPKDVTVTKQFIADISAKPAKATEVPGTVVAQSFEKAKTFTVSGGKEVEGKAKGTVTVYNTTANPQTWRATTRFLSAEGVLFRTPITVSIPANSTKDIVIEADQPGAAGDVEPTRFTIPGLATNLQTRIYAESKVPFTGGLQRVTAVTQADLDAAKKELTQDVFVQAQTALASESKGTFTASAFAYELLESKSDTSPGTEAAQFSVQVKLKVIGVFYDSRSLMVLAKAKLFESLSDELTLKDLDPKQVDVQLDKYDLQGLIANVKVNASGAAILKEGGTILSKDRLAGLTLSEATEYLKAFEEVQDVSISMRPFWVGKLPKLKDHIDIVIVQ